MNQEKLDNDIDLAQDIINGICPSCKKKPVENNWNYHVECIRNMDEIIHPENYEMIHDYNEDTRKLTITTIGGPGIQKQASFTVNCCPTDYKFLLSEFQRSIDIGENVKMVW